MNTRQKMIKKESFWCYACCERVIPDVYLDKSDATPTAFSLTPGAWRVER